MWLIKAEYPALSKGLTVGLSRRSCALGYYSFGHEIAHHSGAQHNKEVVQQVILPHGHGHLIKEAEIDSNGYRSIMAYRMPGYGKRVNYYSNPEES